MVETQRQLNPFRTLISNSSLSSTVSLTQKRRDTGLHIYGGIFFKTRAMKKLCNSFDIGIKMGYYQPVIRGGKWLIKGTNNFVIGDLPQINFDNFFFQLSFALTYDLQRD